MTSLVLRVISRMGAGMSGQVVERGSRYWSNMRRRDIEHYLINYPESMPILDVLEGFEEGEEDMDEAGARLQTYFVTQVEGM
jgi:hypothetical protein